MIMKYLRRFNENADLHALRQEHPTWMRVRQDHPNASDEQIDMIVGLNVGNSKKDLHALRQEHPTWLRLQQEHPNASDEDIDKIAGL